jgi:sugar/nucleoside kinase (ribokinase family)
MADRPGYPSGVIVVVGTPAWRPVEPAGPAGLACGIALAAASAGAVVELVGRTGDDPAGDALLIALARAGVGHVALLRDPAKPTRLVLPVPDDGEPGLLDDADDVPVATASADGPRLEALDVDLGLRYLTDFSVLVLTGDVLDEALAVSAEAAAFAGAHLVLLAEEGSDPPDGIPSAATVLAAPAADPDGAFARFVGAYAAALDASQEPKDAFASALTEGWVPEPR